MSDLAKEMREHVGVSGEGTRVEILRWADEVTLLIAERDEAIRARDEAKGAHAYTLEMERHCGRLLVELNHIVTVPKDSSLFAEIKRLVAERAQATALSAALKELQAHILAHGECHSDGCGDNLALSPQERRAFIDAHKDICTCGAEKIYLAVLAGADSVTGWKG